MTFGLYLDKRGKGKDMPCPVKITLCSHGQTVYLPTGVDVLPTEWDAKRGAVVKNAHAVLLNNIIGGKKLAVQKAAYDLQVAGRLHGLTSAQIKARVLAALEPDEEARASSLVGMLNKLAAQAQTYGTRRNYTATIAKVLDFDRRGVRLSFDEVDKDWLTRFDRHLAKTAPSANSRNIHHRNIRAAFNAGIDDGLTTAYPFRRFKIRPAPTPSRALTAGQVRAFLAASVTPSQQEFRDAWEVSFLLAGANVCDIIRLRTKDVNGGHIAFKRKKTGQPVQLPLCPRLLELFDRYKGEDGFLLRFGARYAGEQEYVRHLNRAIKGIGGLESVSSYFARYSFSTIAAELGWTDDVVGLCLGHAKKGVTSVYIRANRQPQVDACVQAVWKAVYGDVF